MKQSILAGLLLTGMLLPQVPANELPPSDVTPYDLLSPRQHADLYLNLVTLIYSELIPLQDSVTDSTNAAQVATKIEALHSRLNLAISHMQSNPDMAREVAHLLQSNPARQKRYQELQQRFITSWQRCLQTGLISGREFNRYRDITNTRLIGTAE